MTSVESIPAFVQSEILLSVQDLSSKKRRFWHNLTMEPVLGSSVMAVMIASTAFTNAYLQRACMVDLGLSEEVCLRGTGDERKFAEQSSQKLVAQLSVTKSVVSSILSGSVLLFFGPWSDKSLRRKPLVLLPIGGMAVAYLAMLILLMIPDLPVIWMIYLEMIPMSLTGGFSLMFMSSYNYLGDICYKTGKDATSLMGMNSAALQACSVLGALVGPFIYRASGLITVFCISLGFQIFSFVYTWKAMKDVNPSVNNVRFFDLRLPLNAFKALFQKREGNKKKILMLMVVASLMHSFLMSAEMVNMYMYLRNKYEWTEVAYGVFSSYKSVVGCLSTIFIIRVLKKRLHVADEILGVLGTVSHGIVILLLYISSTTLQVFLSPLLGALQHGSHLVHKPILIKQIQGDEQGKINSVIAVLDHLVHLFASPASSALYAVTVKTMPGLFLIPCIFVSFLQSFCFIAISEKRFKFPVIIFSSMYMYYMAQYQ